MSHRHPLHDPPGVEHLPPKTQTRVFENRKRLVKDAASRGPRRRVAGAVARPAAARVNALGRMVEVAAHDLAAFEASVGALAVRLRTATWIGVLLLFAGVVEAFLAFPGIRYSLGDLGQIHYPWQDPLPLVSALLIGALSMVTAKYAGINLAWSERTTMHEPEPASITHPEHTPSLASLDSQSTEDLLGPSAVQELEGLDATMFDRIPPSLEVGDAAERQAAERDAQEAFRSASLLHSPRSRRLHRTIAFGLILTQLGLWTVNGILRASYLARLPQPGASAPSAGGILGSSFSLPHTHTLSPTLTGILIILVSWFFFLLAVGVVVAMHSPAQLRWEDLKQRLDRAVKLHKQAMKDAGPALATHETEQSEFDAMTHVAVNEETAAQLEREELDLGELGLS